LSALSGPSLLAIFLRKRIKVPRREGTLMFPFQSQSLFLREPIHPIFRRVRRLFALLALVP